jgi:hypothetical protein
MINTLRRCINKTVNSTTEPTTLLSENTTVTTIYRVMLKILIFHNWKRKEQWSSIVL